MAEHRATSTNQPLITGLVAAAVLGLVWLMPTAHAGSEPGGEDAVGNDAVSEHQVSAEE
ncbi:hypothetical protein ACFV5N_01475 [Streptomyces sp. NPDC059853]|uniref:hypothetical protein n=1 Tax=Streptomyces sp. NPDC059853 TaxID=3346973 RepID=UPI0036466291